MNEVQRYSVNGTEFGIRESTTGDYVSYEDYAALETEISQLKAQEPVAYQYYYHNHGTGWGEWTTLPHKQAFETMKAKYAGDGDASFRYLYAEPRPAVLPPDIGDVIKRLNKGYFARWVKAYENPLEPEGFVGGSVRVSDLVKLFNFALGYQSLRKE